MILLYNGLSEESINTIISLTAHDVLFGVLAVLDGVRAIDEEKGQLELIYKTSEHDVILNDPSEIDLYELLNAEN